MGTDIKILSLRRLPDGSLRFYSGPGLSLEDKIGLLKDALKVLQEKKESI